MRRAGEGERAEGCRKGLSGAAVLGELSWEGKKSLLRAHISKGPGRRPGRSPFMGG